MDLTELAGWLREQMKERGIPGDAKIDFIDVGNCNTEFLDLDYDPDTNTVRIIEI